MVAIVYDQMNTNSEYNSIVKEGVWQLMNTRNLRFFRAPPRTRTVCAPLPMAAAIRLPKQEEN